MAFNYTAAFTYEQSGSNYRNRAVRFFKEVGGSWVERTVRAYASGLAGSVCYATNTSNTDFYVCFDEWPYARFYHSDDEGETWTEVGELENVYPLWFDSFDGTIVACFQGTSVYFATSSDGCATWDYQGDIPAGAIDDRISASAVSASAWCLDDQGVVHLCPHHYDTTSTTEVYYARSADFGATWSVPTVPVTVANTSPNEVWICGVAAYEGHVVVAAAKDDQALAYPTIHAAVSHDGGVTWEDQTDANGLNPYAGTTSFRLWNTASIWMDTSGVYIIAGGIFQHPALGPFPPDFFMDPYTDTYLLADYRQAGALAFTASGATEPRGGPVAALEIDLTGMQGNVAYGQSGAGLMSCRNWQHVETVTFTTDPPYDDLRLAYGLIKYDAGGGEITSEYVWHGEDFGPFFPSGWQSLISGAYGCRLSSWRAEGRIYVLGNMYGAI